MKKREYRFPSKAFHAWGRQRGGGFAAPKRKPTPPRCARQPLPRERARVDTPSFLWKEVPRRGGGWMGKAVSSTQSLPRVGKVASGASRIGFWRYEREGRLSQVPLYENTRTPPQKEANPASLRSAAPSKGRGLRGHSLLPMEGGAQKGRRLDGGSGMKKSGEIVSGRRFTKASSARKQLIKPIYSYTKRKSNAANDFNVIYPSGC